jgi:hypothetical protein
MKAIDYSLNRWTQLTRFVDDADVPIVIVRRVPSLRLG